MIPRKILILTNRVPYPLKDGGNLAMNAMIEGYHRAGWKVYLLAMNTSRHHIKEDQLAGLFTQLHKFEWVNVDNSLKATAVLKNFLLSREPEHAVRFYDAGYKARLRQALNEFKPDVVQVESVYLSTYLPDVRELSKAITVLRLHNVEYQIWQGLATKHKNVIKQYYFGNLATRVRNFERAAWMEYNLLLPITEKDANMVTRLENVEHMLVAPFGIDTEKIKQGHNERWVGYHIGAMDWIANRAGIKWFIEKAWPQVRRQVPDFEFYFAGRKMPDDFRKLNIPGVHCLDEVASAEDFIADKKILIVPLWSGGGIRVKILEAMAAGKVVITTNTGIKGIEARSGEHYMQARKPEDFAKAIKWCMDNKDLAGKMGANARKLIEEKYEQGKVMGSVIGEVNRLIG
jgi:glycosyltransferase involved in cell wall biosynthesis